MGALGFQTSKEVEKRARKYEQGLRQVEGLPDVAVDLGLQ